MALSRSDNLAFEIDKKEHTFEILFKGLFSRRCMIKASDAQKVLQAAGVNIQAPQGAEIKLRELAHQYNKPIAELETVDAQLDCLKIDADESHKKLMNPEYFQKAVKDFYKLEKAYKIGDEATLSKIIEETTPQLKASCNARNATMANKIDTWLQQGHKTFSAIGALHLFGEGTGLLSLLQAKGYGIERIG